MCDDNKDFKSDSVPIQVPTQKRLHLFYKAMKTQCHSNNFPPHF